MFVLCKAHIYCPVLIVNVLCETQDSKWALLARFMWEAYMSKPAFL